MNQRRRNPWRDAIILMLLCAFAYTVGLTAHGLTNWQEARRAQVGREMFERGEWIVPTYFEEPYIAKPPMIYWAQMAIGSIRGALGWTPFVDETELRLTVALAGVLGVLATYFAARRMLRDPFDARVGDEAAWLSALGLAGGVLYARSSRIGELDVLTVPFVVVAVVALCEAWRAHRERGSTAWGAIALSTIAATGAALTKGPPALLVVALAGYLPMLLHASAGPLLVHPVERVAAAAGFLIVSVLAWFMSPSVGPIAAAIGLLFFGAIGAMLGVLSVRLAERARARVWFAALARTHPLLVLGVPLVAAWLWGRAVASRIGAEAVARLAGAEVEDNLRILVLDSPAKNIGFMLYGLAPMSLAMVAGAIWIVRERPRLTEAQRVAPIWCGAGLAAFSMLGKGVARYLTPVWPGVAMLGGLWLARWLRDWDRSLGHRRARYAAESVLILAIIVQGWWYGAGREIYYADRSPRAFMRELLPKSEGAEVATWRLDEPALDFYARARLPIFDDASRVIDLVRERGVVMVIGRASDAGEWVSAMLDAGFTVKGVELRSRYRWRADRQRVNAWRIERH